MISALEPSWSPPRVAFNSPCRAALNFVEAVVVPVGSKAIHLARCAECIIKPWATNHQEGGREDLLVIDTLPRSPAS